VYPGAWLIDRTRPVVQARVRIQLQLVL
jgi:hypothetical protein